MANVLDAEKQQQILALGRLGWTLRRIEQETGIRRETASRYLKQAGIEVRSPGRWGHPAAKAAIGVITDSGADSKPAFHEKACRVNSSVVLFCSTAVAGARLGPEPRSATGLPFALFEGPLSGTGA